MALKAGYVGVKRWLYEKLQATTAKNVQDIADIWLNNTITGVKNFLINSATSNTVSGITYTVADDASINANGTPSPAGTTSWKQIATIPAGSLPAGKYTLSGCPEGGSDTKYYLMIRENPQGTIEFKEYGEGVTFDLLTSKEYVVYIAIKSAVTNIVYKPMLKFASDPDATYAPYAMTNQQLTGSANDQKTAINAIITAATGAADFAAFKTAMAAISPVTRSAAPDTREASPEVIEDDPEPVAKTTKKTTKKEDN